LRPELAIAITPVRKKKKRGRNGKREEKAVHVKDIPKDEWASTKDQD